MTTVLSARPDALNPYRNSFNAIRLIAALQVVYMHGVAHLGLPRGFFYHFASQFPGVPIFFAVSGFLVLDSYMRHRSIADYARARLLRIYPGLTLNIAVLETVFWLGGGLVLANLSASDWARYEGIFLVTASHAWAMQAISGYPYTFDGFFPIYPSGVLWTLTVELTFYVAVPLFAAIAMSLDRCKATGSLLLLAAVSLAYTFFTAGDHPHDSWASNARMTFVPYLWMFTTGMIGRLWWRELVAYRWLPALALVALLGLAASNDFGWVHWKSRPDLHGILGAWLAGVSAIMIGLTPWLRSADLVRNDISYGVYLWHMLFVATALGLAKKGFISVDGSYLWFAAVIVLAATTAWLSWRYVEKPMLALKRKRDDLPLQQTTRAERI